MHRPRLSFTGIRPAVVETMSGKRKLAAVAKPVVKSSAKGASRNGINESSASVSRAPAIHAVVPGPKSSQHEPIEISSSSSSDYDEDDEDNQDDQDAEDNERSGGYGKERVTGAGHQATKQEWEAQTLLHSAKSAGQTDGNAGILSLRGDEDGRKLDNGHSENQHVIPDDELDDVLAGPTFGDLARGTSTIDVSAALAAAASSANDLPTATTGNTSATLLQTTTPLSLHGVLARQQRPVTGVALTTHSLGTVLNQALRTDDTALLESCLRVEDDYAVQQTVRRMDSGLALRMLDRLAALLHRKPGRASSLVRWIQSTLVAHGGALAAQPDLAARLGSLHGVLAERASALPSLLKLKGKLDMVVAQMNYRRLAHSASAHGAPIDGPEGLEGGRANRMVVDGDGDDEINAMADRPTVVYVEGEEDEQVPGGDAMRHPGRRQALDHEMDEIPAASNGVFAGDTDSEDDPDEDPSDASMDELADLSSVDEDEVDHDDVDDDEDEDEDGDSSRNGGEENEKEEEDEDEATSAPPAKIRRLGTGTVKRR